jgi:Flp pilus assembly CpaE family ATPase
VPLKPEHGEYVTNHHVEALINQLRPYYDFIVLDLPCDLNETTLTAIEAADDVQLVLRRDLTSLRTAKQLFEIFKRCVLPIRSVCSSTWIISPFCHRRIWSKSWRRLLPGIPEDVRAVRACQERGVPFVIDQPGKPASKAVKKMVRGWLDQIAAANSEHEKRGGN